MKKYVLFGLLLSLSNIQSAEGESKARSEKPFMKTLVRGQEGLVFLTKEQVEKQNYGIQQMLFLAGVACLDRSQRRLPGALVTGLLLSEVQQWPTISDPVTSE